MAEAADVQAVFDASVAKGKEEWRVSVSRDWDVCTASTCYLSCA